MYDPDSKVGMVRLQNEFNVMCEECGQPVVRRIVFISGANGVERLHPVDCHGDSCMLKSGSKDALTKANKAVAKVELLREEFRRLSDDQKRLEFGSLNDIDIVPDVTRTCVPGHRGKPMFWVRAFNTTDEFRVEDDFVDIDSIDLPQFLEKIRPRANERANRLRAMRERGDI